MQFGKISSYASLLSFLLLVPFIFVPGSANPADPATGPREKDAQDPKLVLAWLEKANIVKPDKIVFFANGDEGGRRLAESFCEQHTEYKHFYSMFDQEFRDYFGKLPRFQVGNEAHKEIIKVCSKVMASYADKETRIFNHRNAKKGSYWLDIELPELKRQGKVKNIWLMDDQPSVDDDGPHEHKAGDLLNPKKRRNFTRNSPRV